MPDTLLGTLQILIHSMPVAWWGRSYILVIPILIYRGADEGTESKVTCSGLTGKFSQYDQQGSLALKTRLANMRPSHVPLWLRGCGRPVNWKMLLNGSAYCQPPLRFSASGPHLVCSWYLLPLPQVLSHLTGKVEAGSLAPREDETEMRDWGDLNANTA